MIKFQPKLSLGFLCFFCLTSFNPRQIGSKEIIEIIISASQECQCSYFENEQPGYFSSLTIENEVIELNLDDQAAGVFVTVIDNCPFGLDPGDIVIMGNYTDWGLEFIQMDLSDLEILRDTDTLYAILIFDTIISE